MIYFLMTTLCNISYAIKLPGYLSVLGKSKIIVLMYHGIINSYSQNPLKNIYGYNISEKEFEDQMAYLFKYCNVITASEAIAGERLSYDKKNVVITFDDGYRNNYINAFPILLKYNIPALFSIPTAFIVNKVPLWNDIIEYAVAITNKKLVHIKWKDTYFNFKLETTTEKIEFIKWLLSKCVEIIQEERDQFISNVLNELDVSVDNNTMLKDSDYTPLSLQEIKAMSESKMAEFASHSVHHYALSHLNKNILKSELLNSKSPIEDMTGQPCKYLCIPGGIYNNSVIDVILSAGYEKIFSSERSEINPTNVPDIIGRHCITRFMNKALFVDTVHGPFHRMYYSFESRR